MVTMPNIAKLLHNRQKIKPVYPINIGDISAFVEYLGLFRRVTSSGDFQKIGDLVD
jgi:hypothetical protein